MFLMGLGQAYETLVRIIAGARWEDVAFMALLTTVSIFVALGGLSWLWRFVERLGRPRADAPREALASLSSFFHSMRGWLVCLVGYFALLQLLSSFVWASFLFGGFGAVVLLLILWYSTVWAPYEHTAGSGAAMALLLVFVSPVLALGSLPLHSDLPDIPGVGFLVAGIYILFPFWFTATVAMVKFVARDQERESKKEIRRPEHERREVASLLKKVRAEMAKLQSEKGALETKSARPLSARSQVESEIVGLIRLDPANLGLRADDLRKQIRTLSEGQLQERTGRLEQDLQGIRRAKEEAKKELEAVERQRAALDSHRREAAQHLRQLETGDPSNVMVVLQRLRHEWQGMNEAELQRIEPRSEIEQVFRDYLLLERQIQAKTEEAQTLRRAVEDPLAEGVVLMEKHILEREKIDKILERHAPQLSKTMAKIQRLQDESRALEELDRSTAASLDAKRIPVDGKIRIQVSSKGVLAVAALSITAWLPMFFFFVSSYDWWPWSPKVAPVATSSCYDNASRWAKRNLPSERRISLPSQYQQVPIAIKPTALLKPEVVYCAVAGAHSWAVPYYGCDRQHSDDTCRKMFPGIGYILHSSDQGRSWEIQKEIPNWEPLGSVGLKFITETEGYALGDTGIFYSNDGGKQWHPMNLPPEIRRIRGVVSIEGYRLVISVNDNWERYQSSDGGKTWQRGMTSPPPLPTATATPTRTPTPRPTVKPNPSLASWSKSKATVKPGETITFGYYISNPGSSSVSVGLGASIRKTGTTQEISDFSRDKVVSAAPGSNWYYRDFLVPSYALGSYDLILGIWSGQPGSSTGLGNTGWRVGEITVTPSQTARDILDPLRTLDKYYALINDRSYIEAYGLMGSRIKETASLSVFSGWFANKLSVRMEQARLVYQRDTEAEVEATVWSTDRMDGEVVSRRYRERWKLVYEGDVWRLDTRLETVVLGPSAGPAEIEAAVRLANARWIEAIEKLDKAPLRDVCTGDLLASIEKDIDLYRAQNLSREVKLLRFSITGVQVTDNTRAVVTTEEEWLDKLTSQSTGTVINLKDPRKLRQTYYLVLVNSRWLVEDSKIVEVP